MKILKLRFKNLNSLYGEWSIDFTHPDYIENGIFALTGPTGAGKTSILDAICLALYGKTPRLSTISEKENEIMSRQTADCMAEVEFSSQAGQFLCVWSQKRARGQIEGRLQASKHEISQLNAQGQYQVLATKKKEVDALIEEKTGLDYERFIRAMLLAQGSFDAFLKAEEDKKSLILEKITGTQIYTDISKMVHQRAAQAESELKLLKAETQGIVLLTPEQLQSLQAEITQHTNMQDELNKKIESLHTEIRWHQAIHQYQQELEQTQQKVQEHRLAVEKFAPFKQRLLLGQKAQVVTPCFSKREFLRHEQQREQEQHAALAQQLPQSEAQTQLAQQVLEQAKQYRQQENEAAQQQQQLFTQVRELDSRLQHYDQAIQQRNNEIAKEDQKRQQTQTKQQVLVQQAQHLNEQKQAQEQYLQRYAHDAQLSSLLSGMTEQFKQFEAYHKQYDKAQKDCQKKQETLKSLQQEEAEQQQRHQQLEQATVSAQQQYEQALQDIEKLLAGKTIEHYQQELSHAQEKKYLLQQVHDLASTREQLQAGHPCPVCGSLEHPFVDHELPAKNKYDEEINQVKERIANIQAADKHQQKLWQVWSERKHDLSSSEQALKIAQQNIAQAHSDVAAAQENVQQYQSYMHDIKEQLQEQLLVYGVTEIQAGVLTALQRRAEAWTKAERFCQEITQQQHTLQQEAQYLQDLLISLEQSLTEKQELLAKQQQEHQQCLTERHKLFADKSVTSVEKALLTHLKELDKDVDQKQQAYQQNKEVYAQQQAQFKALEQSLAMRAESLQQAQQAFEKQLTQQAFANEEEYLQAVLTEKELNQYQQQAQQLDRKEAELSALLKEHTQRLNTEQSKQLSSRPLTELEQEKPVLTNQLNQENDSLVQLRGQLSAHQKNASLLADKQKGIELQEKENERWQNLRALIGSSEGKTYRNFAQGLTFEIMIHYANQQLQKMSDRYLLMHNRLRPLTLDIMDNYQAGEIRSVKNLSGGESFLVSLALALGLSTMSSKNIRVDSLFLDEGFGTLDEESLETALNVLASLHHENKLIGIISHVSELKHRIATQIQVRPQLGGKSCLSGPGVSAG